jgi:hypothetical protein
MLKPHIKGDTFNGLCFTVTVNGTALDLTNIDINADFRLGSKTGCKVHKYSVGSGIVKTSAINGQFSLLKDYILNWDVGKWYFDVEFTYLDGKVKTYYSDILIIVQDVTK